MIPVRGSPSASKARTVTSSASVESRPPGKADNRSLVPVWARRVVEARQSADRGSSRSALPSRRGRPAQREHGGRHGRCRVHRAGQALWPARPQTKIQRLCLRRIVRARPRRRATALGNQTVEVNIGNRHIAGKELRRRQLRAVFVDEVLARKDHIGRGLALARVRIGIGTVEARTLIGDEATSVICLTDDLVGSGGVENHRGTGKRHLGRGRRRYPQVLTDLDAQHQVLSTLITAAVDKPRTQRNRTLTGKFNPHGICAPEQTSGARRTRHSWADTSWP